MTAALLQRVAAGEAGAVDTFVDRFGGLVWSLARRLSASPEDAEDAAQEIFAEIWSNAQRYDPDVASEQVFVAMIARRRLIDRGRRRSRQLKAEAWPEGDVPSTEEMTDRAEQDEEVERASAALATLRPEQRDALRMSIYEGWSHQEISEEMRLPLGTVKTHIRRGLIQLREMLQAETREPGSASS